MFGLRRTIEIPIHDDLPASDGLEDGDLRIFSKKNMEIKAEGFIIQSVACFLLIPVFSSK